MGLSRYVGKGATPSSTPHGLLRQLSLQKVSAEALPPSLPRQLSSSQQQRVEKEEAPAMLRQCTIFVNTPSYRPWEIVAKEVDHVQFAKLAPLPIDMWANGVILVELLLGEHAFKLGKLGGGGSDSESTTELKALLQALPLNDEEKGKLSTECFQKRSSGQEYIRRANCANSLYDKLRDKGCSAEALSLVRGLLAVDPSERFTALQVLEHSWLRPVRQLAREKKFFASCSSVKNTFDQDAFSKLSLSAQVKQLKAAIGRVFMPPRTHLSTAFFKEEAKQKCFAIVPGSEKKSSFRHFKVGQMLWAKDESSGEWCKVELREKCAAGGWNVKYPMYEQLFYLPSAVLHIFQPSAPLVPEKKPEAVEQKTNIDTPSKKTKRKLSLDEDDEQVGTEEKGEKKEAKTNKKVVKKDVTKAAKIVEAKANTTEKSATPPDDENSPRKRGRPAGTTKRAKSANPPGDENSKSAPRRPGRPVGTTKRAKSPPDDENSTPAPRGRGRPAGTTKRAKSANPPDDENSKPAPRKRGRPAGTTKRAKSANEVSQEGNGVAIEPVSKKTATTPSKTTTTKAKTTATKTTTTTTTTTTPKVKAEQEASSLTPKKTPMPATVSETAQKDNSSAKKVKASVPPQPLSGERDVKHLPMYSKVWAMDDDEWVSVELRHRKAEGWDVKFPGYRSLYYVPFSGLWGAKP